MKHALKFLILVSFLLFPVSNAFADGAITSTQTFHNVTSPLVDINQCTGESVTGAITYNGVLHTTETPDGGFHFDVAFTGDFVAIYSDGSVATGKFTTVFADNYNQRNETHTHVFTVNGTRSNGTDVEYHFTQRLSFNANGEAVVDFFLLNCRCRLKFRQFVGDFNPRRGNRTRIGRIGRMGADFI